MWTRVATSLTYGVERHHRHISYVGLAEYRSESGTHNSHLHVRRRTTILRFEFAVGEGHRDRCANVDTESVHGARADRHLARAGRKSPVDDHWRGRPGGIDREEFARLST